MESHVTFQQVQAPLTEPPTAPLSHVVSESLAPEDPSAVLRVPDTLLARPTNLRPIRARVRREAIYRRLLAGADALSASVVTLTAALATDVGPKLIFSLVPFFAVLVAKIQGLYDRDDMVIRKSTLSEWRGLLQAALLTGICTYTAWHLVTTSDQQRGVRLLAFLVLGTFLLTFLTRVTARRIALWVAPNERCVIVGTADSCRPMAQGLATTPGVELVDVIASATFGHTIDEVQSTVERLGVQRVVIGTYGPSRELQTLELIRSLKWLNVRVSLMPSFMGVVGEATVADDMDGTVVLGVPAFGTTPSSALIKRCFDLTVGTAMCLLMAVPAAILAAWIRFDSPGPAIFRQTRIGKDGHPFTMYKFRSMVVDAEHLKPELHEHNEAGDGLFKIHEDPRITRVGRLIRKAYLDEIPQLLNVMRGDMSIVGPRPLIASEDLLLTGSDRHRLALLPGMTGLWQLRGPLESSLPELAKLDYLYASNWSIWRDLDIILETVVRIVRRHGK
jgi:exopolysaccharide biosynthesis polyprenyl glycosylphosphotransferase